MPGFRKGGRHSGEPSSSSHCCLLPACTSGWGRCDNDGSESVALYIWHRRIIELIVFSMTGRGSGERSAVPECSITLFSILCIAPAGPRGLTCPESRRRSARRQAGSSRQPLAHRSVPRWTGGKGFHRRRRLGEWGGGLVGGAQAAGSAQDAASYLLPARYPSYSIHLSYALQERQYCTFYAS